MRSFLPPQITRLALLTAAIVAAYAVARYFLYPASFGQYGYYRALALQEAAEAPLVYAGAHSCAECHEEIVLRQAAAQHKTVSCEACHGAAGAHVEDPVQFSPDKIVNPRFCLRCHEESPSRPADFPAVNSQEHFADQPCRECHQAHAPKEFPSP